ncbi:MBL fold metallo-hydrolase [Pseudomonas sp. CAN2814]|uniref:MBL fold metallo-hydrolase n=1 Tax=Pseudomonas sp. CAN1 TaxID=3046726 RepID=UPI00264A29FC|nr:MBL fold metallo-hydrolase [Pseudomonas sp. CAN1]MDN6859203.1 MBL fold metallo-hydrolase [Pseudomonas sp. CAN1]
MRLKWKLALPALLLAAVAAGVVLNGQRIQEAILDAEVRDRTDNSLTNADGSIRVILCGTGTPQVNAPRGQACTLVAAGGQLFLFDAGENAMRNIEDNHVPLPALNRVFITHWHSDHFNGLGALINHTWINGRKTPFEVYGPRGVEQVVKGLAMAYAEDVEFRHLHALPAISTELAYAQAHVVEMADDAESMRVFEQDGVTIDAFRVDHRPVDPAFGYVLRYNGKKVFISGDTRVTERYFGALQDADLVVHEAINGHLIRMGAAALQRTGQTAAAAQAVRVLDYHADTLGLARLAEKAKVRHLVLTHLIPSPTNFVSRQLFLRGMQERFSGELTLGEDAMEIRL